MSTRGWVKASLSSLIYDLGFDGRRRSHAEGFSHVSTSEEFNLSNWSGKNFVFTLTARTMYLFGIRWHFLAFLSKIHFSSLFLHFLYTRLCSYFFSSVCELNWKWHPIGKLLKLLLRFPRQNSFLLLVKTWSCVFILSASAGSVHVFINFPFWYLEHIGVEKHEYVEHKSTYQVWNVKGSIVSGASKCAFRNDVSMKIDWNAFITIISWTW